MGYKVLIEYTSNLNKAGKLTVRDDAGTVYINKAPVALPRSVIENKPIVYANVTAMKITDDTSNMMKINNFDRFIELSGVKPSIVAQSGTGVLKRDPSAFVMRQDDFDKLHNIVNTYRDTSLATDKVPFLWFPEKVENDVSNVQFGKTKHHYEHVKENNANLERLEAQRAEESRRQAEESRRQPTKVDTVKKSRVATPASTPVATPERKAYNQLVSQTKKSNNNDPFDIMFMYSYPELALFYRPNSLLAWHLYFNRLEDINSSNVISNMNTIPGFESVGSADVRYTASGYRITLYEDTIKSNKAGVLEYDNTEKCYRMTSPTGAETVLEVNSNGKYSGFVACEGSDKTSFNFVEKHDGIVGNWESEQTSGIKISSGVSFDNDFNPKSTVFQSVDVERVVLANEAQKVLEDTYKHDYTPPPPPPKDDQSWSSSYDSYSNGSSFRM